MVVWEGGGLKRGATVAVRSSLAGIPARSLLAAVSPPLRCTRTLPPLAHSARWPMDAARGAPVRWADDHSQHAARTLDYAQGA